ncbi:hypothetical protein [Acuticoccus yangtzensis]|uniref:hypothetical protein n=1 Tax=Acuticoccus yangtzensis TaxID=1443441 RepID=UPI00196B7823|nr:hypothetical protein [Acuticoccus yangtzensis]
MAGKTQCPLQQTPGANEPIAVPFAQGVPPDDYSLAIPWSLPHRTAVPLDTARFFSLNPKNIPGFTL